MTTIEIIKEPSNLENVAYRAKYGELQAVRKTPGQALDALESLFTEEQKEKEEGTLVIVQRFSPDRFFNSFKQVRLRELMDKFHHVVKEGQKLSLQEMAELEELVNAEYQGAAERAAAVLKEASQ